MADYKKQVAELSDSELAKDLAFSDMRSIRKINRDDFEKAGYILFRTDASVPYKNKAYATRQSKSNNPKTSPLRTEYYRQSDKLFKKLKATRPEVSSAPFAPYHPDVEEKIKQGLAETGQSKNGKKKMGGGKVKKNYAKGGGVRATNY